MATTETIDPRPTTRFGNLTGLELIPGGSTPRRPVLFVHGWWGGAWVWDRFMTRFAARGYPCYAVNLRGNHGSGGVDIADVSFADHLADMKHAISVLGDPILVTHSASGHIALKLAEHQKLPGVIHLAPTPPPGKLTLRIARGFLRYIPRLLRAQPIVLDKAARIAADLNRLPPAEQDAVYSRMVPAPGRQGREMLYTRVDAERVSTRGPRLIVTGGDDRLVPASVHRAMAEQLDCDIREYPNHAHYLMREPGWQDIADDCTSWLNSELLS